MKKRSNELLLKEIEMLRSKLHASIDVQEAKNHDVFVNDQLLELSKQLDKLILEYMKLK